MKHEWSAGETDVLARAVVRAPSVHNTQPWWLELPDGEALVFERRDLELPFHDALGRDRSISCGAAIANLDLGMRVLAQRPDVALLPDPGRPELVARLTVTRTVPPTDTDLHRYSAIARRRSYRHAFGDAELSDYDVKDLIAASTSEGVQVKVLRGGEDLTALAEVLEYAALTVARDRGYQRELTLWTIHDGAGPARSTGIADGTLPSSSLPWAGLVRPNTALPDRDTLAQRLERETVLVFLTPGDTRLDHLRTGIGMQHTWLAAVDMGLAGAVQTQPLHLSEARASFIEKLGLAGYPQLLMRVGHPAVSGLPQSPRQRAANLLNRLDS